MTKRGTSRHMLPILAVVAIIIVAGGTAIASNAGFKLNMGVTIIDPGGSGQHGNNWLALPYFNPYTTPQDACDQLGLLSLPNPAFASFTKIDVDGVPTPAVCGGTNSGLAGYFEAGQAVRLRLPVGNPGNLIIVGSHDPTLSVTIPTLRPAGTGAQDNVWFATPYHTTWTTIQNLCDGFGLNSSTAGGLLPDTVLEIDAAPLTGSATTHSCGFTAAAIELGRGYRIRRASGLPDTSAVPAHF